MRRSLLVILLAAAACGGKQKSSTPPPPLPEPNEAKPVEEAKPAEPAPPPAEPDPIEVTVAPPKVTVKLVNGGKGKKTPLKLSPKAGTKQVIELALDFRGKTTGAPELGGDSEDTMPTIVLSGEAEVKNVTQDGTAEYQLVVTGSDARQGASGGKMTVDQAKELMSSLHGLIIDGSLNANGTSGDLKLRMDKPTPMSAPALQLITITMPSLPVLPKEPIGVGAKWQVSSVVKLAEQLDVTQTTDYELVSRKGTTVTIKGKTKVTGADQMLGIVKASKINGGGAIDATLEDGTLYPAMKSELKTGFTLSGTDPNTQKTIEGTLDLQQGAAITPKS